MLMEFNHGPDCGHCQHGCQHPHDEWEPYGLFVGPLTPTAPCTGLTAGKKGAYITNEGLTLASNNWHPVICVHCSHRALTPVEAIPIWAHPAHDDDGNILSRCGPCKADIADGYRPGTGPHSARARRRR